MTIDIPRAELPDFERPPINEMVLGVQFNQPPGYNSLNAADVRQLYHAEFPHLEEHSPLAPAFETFGTRYVANVYTNISINLTPVLSHSRYWFVGSPKNELIQFQPDRLLHNWRKVGRQGGVYPRFDAIVAKFERELRDLEKLFMRYGSNELGINQCEISYINHIVDPNSTKEPMPSDWLSFLHLAESPSDLSINLRKNLLAKDGTPFARLIVEANSAIDAESLKFIVFQLTVRGAPEGSRIEDAVEFLRFGRATAVAAFKALTTSKAHALWGIVS